MTHKIKGFTLIELMITVAIVAILAAIAYPSYTEYVMKSRRSDAKAGLLSLQLAQEKYRANCRQYATIIDSDSADYSCATGNFTLTHQETSPDKHYDLSIVSADSSASSYRLRATRKAGGPQANDKCGNFEIVFANGQITKALQAGSFASGYDAASCW